MKKVLIVLIVIILIIFCIYLENHKINEKFTIDIDKYVNNDINTQLMENINKLSQVNVFRKPNINNIALALENELDFKNDAEYNISKIYQSDALRKLENEINEIQKDPEFTIAKHKNKNYKSIKSQENSQPINLLPLSNDKYLISLNGKCLESDNINTNSIQPCNLQNPNQYFNLELITSKDEYKKHTFGEIHNPNINYPFSILKSEFGNCVGTKDQLLSIGPCKSITMQRWNTSEEPVLCMKKQSRKKITQPLKR